MRLISDGPFAGLGDGHFGAIYADPPWHYVTYNGKRSSRSPRYQTMTLDAIQALPVCHLARNPSWLFLWTSPPFLALSLATMRAWGFRYSSTFTVWVKTTKDGRPRKGLGRTSRKSCEFVLLGKIGQPKILFCPDEILMACPREHSRKPAQVAERIEQFCPGPRIELFARESRPGWVSWGDQRTLFDAPAHGVAH